MFETLEDRVLLTGNPCINLSNGVANSFIGGQYSWVQIPIRIDNLQDSAGDVGLSSATVQLSFSTSASIATAANGGATESGNTVTITTKTAKSFVAGESVSISGVNNTNYNGNFIITAVLNSTTFTYNNPDYADLANSGGGKAAASFFQEGPVQTAANPNDGPSNWSPIVVKGPLVSLDGWSFSVSQGNGTVKIVASDHSWQDYDITASDPTNGGTSPDGDILAYLFLFVEGDTASLPNVPVTVVDSATSLVEDGDSSQQTSNSTYPTLDPDQNASVQLVTDSTAPVAELSVDTQGIGTASGGTQYTVPVMLTPSTPGGLGVRLAEADLLFNPNYIEPNSISVLPGNLIPQGQRWYWGGNVSVGGNYSEEGAPPSVDRAAIQLWALGVTTTNVCNIASNSTGSLWVVKFTTMPGVTGSTVLNLAPCLLSAFPEFTSVQDGNSVYWNYTLSPAPTEGLSDAVDGTINFPPPVSTTTTVASSIASTTYGTPVTFTATVSAQSGSVAPADGSLEFFDSTTSQDLGAGVLSNSSGAAAAWTLATSPKTLNATSGDTITASYTAGMGFANSSGATTETVTPRHITVTAAANTKTYNGTTAASATPTISGNLVSGDTAAFAEVFDSANVGTGQTLTPAGSVGDENGGGNYAVTFQTSPCGQINPLASTTTLNWSGPLRRLSLTDGVSGATPAVVISEPSPNVSVLKIDLGPGYAFSGSSTAAASGLTYQNAGSPTTSEYALIDISLTGNVSQLEATMPGDQLTLGPIRDLLGGVGAITASADTIDVRGIDTLAANSEANSGDVSLSASGNLTVAPGAVVEAGTGTLSLAADTNAGGTAAGGTGTLAVGAGATVSSTNTASNAITLRGADISLDASANPAVVGRSARLSATPTATLTGLNNPFALAFSPAGSLYVTNGLGSTVSEFNPGAVTPSAYAQRPWLSRPLGLRCQRRPVCG